MKKSDTPDTNMTPEKRLGRIEETVRSIIVLLGQETQAVKAINLQTFNDIQSLKTNLFEIYHDDIKAILIKKGDLKFLPEPAKERIRKLERDLSVARTENMAALERAGKSFSRLRDRVVHIARDTVLRNTAQYGSNGQLQMNIRKPISTGLHDRV